MRVVFFTSEFEFGEKSLAALLGQKENIAAVVIPPARENDRSKGVVKIAENNNIPVYRWKSIRDQSVVDKIKKLNADLGVSAGNKRFVFTREVIDSFKHGVVNYHCSLLPKNGGQFPIHWQIYKGEPEIGITVHYCDEGIDTGDLILQETVPLAPDDTFKSIYFGCVLQKSVDLLATAVRMIREERAPRICQDLSQSTYNHPFGEKEATINWGDSAEKIYNTIRACDAWPGARTVFRGETLKIWQARKQNSSWRQPGEITAVGEQGMVVSAVDGSILIERVQLGSEPKLMLADFIKIVAIEEGERLG